MGVSVKMHKVVAIACVYVVVSSAMKFLWQAMGSQDWYLATEQSIIADISVFGLVFTIYVTNRRRG
jgi:hypothetical protein